MLARLLNMFNQRSSRAKARALGLLSGDRAGAGPSPQRRRATFFPAALTGRFLARQESRAPPSSAALRPSGFACGCRSVPPPAG